MNGGVRSTMSTPCSPLPPVPRSYNIDVLTVRVCMCVYERAAVGLTVPSSPQQDMEAGGLTSLLPAMGMPIIASICLLTHFHPSTDSV